VLDYQLADRDIGLNLDRLLEWTGESQPNWPPRHDFGVLQPGAQSIDATSPGAGACGAECSVAGADHRHFDAVTPAWGACVPSRRSSCP
jgi:hypothetical protein